MPRTLKPDYKLFATILTLAGLGMAMVFSASAPYAQQKIGDANYFSFRQLLACVLGMVLLFLIMKVDYHVYQKPILIFTALSVVIGLCVLVFFFPPINDTYRWIHVPGISFQPSELAKIALVIFMASFLSLRKGRVNEIATLIPVGIILSFLTGLILLQGDLGTAVALLLTAFILLYVAGLSTRLIGITALASLPVGYVAFYFLVYRVPYRWARILAYLNPEAYPRDIGYQILQSLTAVGTGGVFGLGYGEGKQKLLYLPDGYTDFIFAIIGEELGLIGALLVLTLFVLLLWRGLRAAVRAPDTFGFYLGLGITMTICVQAFINISVVLGIVPNKGIPLPFISYGGSSFVVMAACVGILLNISQHGSGSSAGRFQFPALGARRNKLER